MKSRLSILVLLAIVPAFMFFTNKEKELITIGNNPIGNGAGTITVTSEYVIKTVENSTVKIGAKSFEIDAVSGKVVQMDLTLKDSMAYQIYLVFYEKDANGNFTEIAGSEMNADRDDFTLGVKKVLPTNTSASTLKATVNQVMGAMIAGTPTQKFNAFNSVMTGYGAPLLPLAQQ